MYVSLFLLAFSLIYVDCPRFDVLYNRSKDCVMLPTEKIYGIQTSNIFIKIRKDSCGLLWAVYKWAIYNATIIILNKLYDAQ